VDFSGSSSGWTTITEGLVKQLYFKRFQPGILHLGKIHQILLAIGFNCRISKDAQLDLFINSAYLGELNGRAVYGFDNAARVYFGKQFSDLSRQEYVSLVATLVSPAMFNPVTQRENNLERVRRIERLLNGACASSGKSDVLYAGCGN
jgi:membrane carboxypeptidase/penicillin-binding protein